MNSLRWDCPFCHRSEPRLQRGMPRTTSPGGSLVALDLRLGLCPPPLPPQPRHATGDIPQMCPSPSSPPHPRRRAALSQPLPAVGGVGSSLENRLGAAPPLGRGGRHLADAPGGRRHRCTYPVPARRRLPARPPLPALTRRLPWTGPRSPGSRPCGTALRTSRTSGEAQSRARARRSPLHPAAWRGGLGGEPQVRFCPGGCQAPAASRLAWRDPAGPSTLGCRSLLEGSGARTVPSWQLGPVRWP